MPIPLLFSLLHCSTIRNGKNSHHCILAMRSVSRQSVYFLSNHSNSFNIQDINANSDLWRLQTKSAELIMLDGHINAALAMPTDWAKEQWVMVYIFSDQNANKYGFGAYVPRVGTQYYEKSETGTFDMEGYASSHEMRIGSNNSGLQEVSNLRKMLIYKGTGYHSTSSHSIDELLQSVECPKIKVRINPACQGTYFYFIMSSQTITDSGQTIIDSSGNSINALNGSSSSSDSADCISQQDAILFTGTCYLQVTSVIPSLSSRGFSIQFDLKVSPSAQTMEIIKEIIQNKFTLSVDPSSSEINLNINAESSATQGCTALQSNNWITIALSLIANDSQIYYQIFCEYSLILQGTNSKQLNFDMSSFRIGDGLIGRMRDFKVYYLPMGSQSFTQTTIIGSPPACLAEQYYDLDLRQCEACPSFCQVCNSSSTCSECVNGATISGGACSCSSDYYQSGNRCLQCDSLCNGCTGAGNTACVACAAGSYPVDGTTACVSQCTQYSLNHYLNGTVCAYCAPPNYTGFDFCSSCVLEGYSITDTGECQEICGDGQLLSSLHQCDDGNTVNGDGCSSSCLIESGYLCERSASSHDTCNQIKNLAVSSFEINSESFQASVSFSEAVLLQNLTIDKFEFNYINLSSEDVLISLSQNSTGLQTSFALQITPQASISKETTLSFVLHTQAALSSLVSYIQVPENIESPSLTLPEQQLPLISIEEAAQPVGQAMSWTTILLLIGLSVSQLIWQSSMESMWVLICINQLISYMPLMSITFPSNMLLLFNILTFFNGDIYVLLLAYEYSVGLFFNFPGESVPYNDRFALLGYQSVKLMDNSGVFISIWLFLLFFVMTLLISRKICNCLCCVRSSNRLLRCVIWGPILRTFLVTFLELGFCAYINMVSISFESIPDMLSSFLSLLVLITLTLLPFILLHILTATPATLEDKQYKQRFGQVYKDFDYANHFVAVFYYPIFLLHRYFFMCIIFGVFYSGPLQSSLMIIATILFMIFLIRSKPFSLKLDRFLHIIALVILTLFYIFCLIFSLTDESSFSRERQIIGYVFVFLVLLFFIFTCALILSSKVSNCLRKKHRSKKNEVKPEQNVVHSESAMIIALPNAPIALTDMFHPTVNPTEETAYREETSILEHTLF